ncbi:MAG TPA: cytochrome c [Bacillota bacterium]|nr:cytochrome c [Bacillota bacterium]
MSKRPLVVYGLIAGLGLAAVILISFLGANQREDILLAEEGGEVEEQQEGETANSPEDVFKSNCASCHGEDLSGGGGPDLTQIGGKLSADEIKEIILNGTESGAMPPIDLPDPEAEELAKWLEEKK